jgi:hypothetical protein
MMNDRIAAVKIGRQLNFIDLVKMRVTFKLDLTFNQSDGTVRNYAILEDRLLIVHNDKVLTYTFPLLTDGMKSGINSFTGL